MKKQLQITIIHLLLFVLIAGIPIASGELSDGLVAYYPFDGNATDISGNTNDGTEYGGVEYTMGVEGSAASFDGLDDHIRVSSNPSLNPVDQLSISFWIWVDGYTNVWSPIVHKGGGTTPYHTNREYSFWLHETSAFLISSAGDGLAQVPYYSCCAKRGFWTHYVGIIDRQNQHIRVYVDGVLKTDETDPYSTFNTNNEDLIFGWTDETPISQVFSPFNGKLDELRIYNRVITEDEVKTLYNKYSTSINQPMETICESTFDVGLDGWTGNPSELSWRATGGNPDGYALWVDVGADSLPLSAPAKFLGDWSKLDSVGTISFDQKIISTGNFDHRSYIRINIAGTGGAAWWIGPRAPSSCPGGVTCNWTTYVAPILESQWIVTHGSWSDLLHSVTIFQIQQELYSNICCGSEISGIDNVKIQAPDPVASSYLIGEKIKVPGNYEFILEQGTQNEFLIQFLSASDNSQIASLEVINPHSDLTVSLTLQNPITIEPGESFEIPVNFDAGSMPVGEYDDLLFKIDQQDGDTLYSNIKITIVEPGTGDLPDLSIRSDDIELDDYILGESATFKTVVHNNGLSAASNFLVQFYEFENLLGEVVVDEIPPGDTESVSITVPITTSGEHLIRVVVDSSGTIDELDERNNDACKILMIGSPVAIPGNILVTGSLPSTVYTDHLFTISGRAVYDIYVDGTRYTNYVVKGGSVQITIKGDGGTEWVYGDVHTDINGNFSKVLQAPASPETYRIIMTVTDNTFIGKRELELSVTEPLPPSTPPPLPPTSSGIGIWTYSSDADTWNWTWTTPPVHEPTSESDLRVYSENIHFSTNNPAPDEEITVFAEILYWASSTALVAQDIPVHFYVTYPGSPRMKIGETVIDRISVGAPDFGSRYVYTTWKNHHEGVYIVEVEIDPNYVEENQLNNAATRAIIVGQIQSFSGVISGQVTDPWGGVGNVIIELYDSNGTTFLENKLTDDTGYYLFENVPVDEYQVHIIKPDGYEVDAQAKTAIVSDQSVSVVDFQLRKQNPPIADAGDNFTLLSEAQHSKVLYGWANDPDGDPLTYRWFEGDQVLKDWTNVGANGEARLDLSAVPDFLPGSHELTLEVSDGIYSPNPTDSMVLAINNSPPYVVASAGGTYQVCTEVQLNGSAGDYDGDSLQYRWFERITDELGSTVENTHCSGTVASIYGGEPVSIATCSITACSLEMGEHTFVLEVTDSVNEAVQDETLVKVIDTSAPTLKPVPSTFILWPPNHKMVDVTIVANAVDNTGDPVVLSATVNSSEPPDASGDGATMPDFTEAVIDQTTGIISLQLRAERAGGGIGRTYTITITATDQSDNFSTANVSILAPHDISGAK